MAKTHEPQAEYNLNKLKRENAALRKYAAIQKASEEKVCVQKIYVDMTGELESALVLDEIVFFTLPRNGSNKSGLRVWKDGVLWLAVQRAEWWDRKRLKARQADLAISKLENMNLIIKTVHKFNGQSAIHLRLNVPVFFKLYADCLEKENPPENQGDTLEKDINDLYEMMGLKSELPNGDSQNGETESPNRETELPNGDSINNPHTSHTQPLNDKKDIERKYKILEKLYYDNIGNVVPLMKSILRNAVIDYPDSTWYEPAFQLAVKNMACNWTYIETILKSWKVNGFGWKPDGKQPVKSLQPKKSEYVEL